MVRATGTIIVWADSWKVSANGTWRTRCVLGDIPPSHTPLDLLSQDPDAVVEDDGQEKSYLGAEERAKAAFEAVLMYGTKIQGDHHLVFHTRAPSQTCALSPERLTGGRRL